MSAFERTLIACSVDVNVSQGSVAPYARCGGVFNNHFTSYLLENLSVKQN